MKTKFIVFSFIAINFYVQITGQEISKILNTKEDNYFSKIKKIEEKISRKDNSITDKELKRYYRYRNFWDTRIDNQGSEKSYISSMLDLQLNPVPTLKSVTTINWTNLGPFYRPVKTTIRGTAGIGRMESIWVDEDNPLFILAGACTGGLWKTTDGGHNWTCITNNSGYFGGVEYIEVDPNDPSNNTIYITSSVYQNGLLDGYLYGHGIYKTTNGGASWTNITASTIDLDDMIYLRCVKVKPGDSNIVLTCGNNKIFRSTDAGVTWNTVKTGNELDIYKQILFHPTTPSVLYACSYYMRNSKTSGGTIERSVNSGEDFSVIKNGDLWGVALAVHPDSANNLYALYKEKNSVNNFTNYTLSRWNPANPWKDFGTTYSIGNSASKMPYVIELEITSDWDIYGSNVELFQYNFGSNSFAKISDQYNSSINYMHADVRQIFSINNPSGYDTVFIAHDGGISKISNLTSSPVTILDINSQAYINGTHGIAANQYYNVSISDQDPDIIFGGTHDCGMIYQHYSNDWECIQGGDGGLTAIDYSNPNIMYHIDNSNSESMPCRIAKHTGGPSSGSSIQGIADLNIPFYLHPKNPDTIYTYKWIVNGYPSAKLLWSVDGGADGFSEYYADIQFNCWDPMRAFAISEDNTNFIYYAGFYETNYGSIYRTTNGLPSTMSRANESIEPMSSIVNEYPATGIDFIKDGEDIVALVCFAGYINNRKVLYEKNGNGTWYNLSTGLPNIPINCITVDDLTETIYVGTDWGVYYCNDLEGSFTLFGNNFPKVIVSDIEINNTTREMIVSTYGRGIWETDLSNTINVPDLIMDGIVVTWSSDFTCYRNVILKNNAILTLDGNITLDDGNQIIIEENSALVLGGGGRLNINTTASVKVEEGGTFLVGAEDLYIYGSGNVNVESGGYICIHEEALVSLSACYTTIDLYANYNSGVNTSVITFPVSCSALHYIDPAGIGILRGEDTNSPYIISGGNIGSTVTYQKDIIHAGTNLGSSGSITVTSSGNLTLESNLEIKLGKNFSVDGGELELIITDPCE